MLVLLASTASPAQQSDLQAFLRGRGAEWRHERRCDREVWILTAGAGAVSQAELAVCPGVERVLTMSESYLLASRLLHPQKSIVSCGTLAVGGQALALAAGPCAIEGREQLDACARAARAAGAKILRGGSFKPRTSPYSFQGLAEEGLRLHRETADRHGLLVMSEVLDREGLPLVAEYADVLQAGSRNMQNFPLLKALGRQEKPVLLKRGLAATREELLLAAEYILQGGNGQVILCERGVRSFDAALRHTLDLASVCLLKEMTHLPVLVDPSHATGRADLVPPMARAAVAAGADGLLIEIHPDPARALSDGPQALTPEGLLSLAREIETLAPAVHRSFEVPP